MTDDKRIKNWPVQLVPSAGNPPVEFPVCRKFGVQADEGFFNASLPITFGKLAPNSTLHLFQVFAVVKILRLEAKRLENLVAGVD